jgi:hypothetical protein
MTLYGVYTFHLAYVLLYTAILADSTRLVMLRNEEALFFRRDSQLSTATEDF